MSYFYRGITFIVMVFGLISCSTSPKEFSPPVFEKQVKLKYTVIQDELMLMLPREMISFDNYIIFNSITDGKYLHVYDKQTGEYLGGYVVRGQGPGEIVTWCESLDYNKKERIMTVTEINTNHCVSYAVNDDPENLLTFVSKKNLLNNNTNTAYFERLHSIFKIDENLYLSDSQVPPIPNDEVRFSLITETGEKTSEYNGFATDDIWAYGLLNKISISPNRKKMAHTIFYGAVLETFEIGASINLIQEKLFYPTIVNDDNKEYTPLAIRDKTIFGFSDICTSDEYIFSIFYGDIDEECDPRNISVFDWNGDPVIRFETDINLHRICYNEDDNMIYAVARTEHMEYIFVKFDISDYL